MSLSLLLAAASAVSSPVSAANPNVSSYPAAFFAASSPNNAMDMVSLLPGFVFDGGGQVRGFAGAAGNVLIDGARPASKDDPLQLILQRIPCRFAQLRGFKGKLDQLAVAQSRVMNRETFIVFLRVR